MWYPHKCTWYKHKAVFSVDTAKKTEQCFRELHSTGTLKQTRDVPSSLL